MGEGGSVRGRPINPFAWGEKHVSVTDPSDGTWQTIQIHRAHGWPGWMLIDRVSDLGGDDHGIVLALALLLEIASIPSRVLHRIRHPRRQSTEWEVLVDDRGGADYRPPAGARDPRGRGQAGGGHARRADARAGAGPLRCADARPAGRRRRSRSRRMSVDLATLAFWAEMLLLALLMAITVRKIRRRPPGMGVLASIQESTRGDTAMVVANFCCSPSTTSRARADLLPRTQGGP